MAAYYESALKVMGLNAMNDAMLAGGGAHGWSNEDDVFVLLTVDGRDIDTQRPVYVLTTLALPDR